MKVKSQLVDAQIESRAGAPTTARRGEVVVDTTASNQVKYSDGAAIRTVANTDQAQTLTNKSIAAGANTITGLTHGSEVDNPTSGVHGVVGSVVGTTDSQTITGKTFDDALLVKELATPSTPAAGYKKVYPKANNKLYTLDDTGLELEVGSDSGGGSKNYFSDINSEVNANSVVGVVAYDDTGAYVDGTGGSPATVSVAATNLAAELLGGEYSVKMIKAATDGSGEGLSILSKTIDRQDYGRVMKGSVEIDFTEMLTSGDWALKAYDVTNGVILAATGDDVDAIPNKKGKLPFEIALGATTASVRLSFHLLSDSDAASTYDLFWNDVRSGPGGAILVATDGPVGEIISSASAVTPSNFLYCDGTAVLRSTYADLFDSIGTNYGNGDGSTTFNLPDLRGLFLRGQDDGSGNDPDAAGRVVNNTGGNTGDNVGSEQADQLDSHTHLFSLAGAVSVGPAAGAQRINQGSSNNAPTDATGGNETRPKNVNVRYYVRHSNGGNMISTAEALSLTAEVDGRGNAATVLTGAVTDIDFIEVDDPYAHWNGTQFTARKTAYYSIEGAAQITAGAVNIYSSYIDGTIDKALSNNISTNFKTFSGIVKLVAGEVLSIRSDLGVTLVNSTANHHIAIKELPIRSTYGVFGEAEYLAVTSSVKTPGASNQYSLMTGNSVILTPGVWKITGEITFGNGGVSPAYASVAGNWCSANGADSAAQPALTTVQAGKASLTGHHDVAGGNITVIPGTIRKLVTATETLYLVPYQTSTTPANVRITTYIYAERIA